MKKRLATLGLVLGLSVAGSMSAFAEMYNVGEYNWEAESVYDDGQWIQDDRGWKYQLPNGVYLGYNAWIDGNRDGIAELYYFDDD